MAQEDRWLAFLGTVASFTISPEGHLILIPEGDAAPSRLAPIEEDDSGAPRGS
jgi:hypothetical protein